MSACVNTSAASSTHIIANAWVFADDFRPHHEAEVVRAPLQVRQDADTTELGRYKCNPLYDRGWSSRAEGVSVITAEEYSSRAEGVSVSTAEQYMVCPPMQTPHSIVSRAQ